MTIQVSISFAYNSPMLYRYTGPIVSNVTAQQCCCSSHMGLLQVRLLIRQKLRKSGRGFGLTVVPML